MRRQLAYALGFLVVIGLAAAGVFTHSRPNHKGPLISVAQAMEKAARAETIHAVGHGASDDDKGQPIPGGKVETWISPTAFRQDVYTPDGSTWQSTVVDAAKGEKRLYLSPTSWYPKGLVYVSPLGKETAEESLAPSREVFLDGLRTDCDAGPAHLLREETRDGQRVQVFEVLGKYGGRMELEIAADTGYLLASQSYWPQGDGGKLIGGIEKVEYNLPLSPENFTPSRFPEAVVLEAVGGQGPGGYSGANLLKPSSTWHLSSSVGGNLAAAIDGDPKTVWSSGRSQRAGTWFQLTFDQPTPVYQVIADSAQPVNKPGEGSQAWPRGSRVTYTCDGRTWQDAYTGQASEQIRSVWGYLNGLKQVKALRITLSADDDQSWSISELHLCGPPRPNGGAE